MKIKDLTFYLGAIAVIGSIFYGLLPPTPSQTARADYQEECINEGCNGEEVEEMCESYTEECRHEGCSKEEVFELGGSVEGTQQLANELQRRGCTIVPGDFQGTSPFCAGTTTFCRALVLFCNDHCTFPDGSTSSSYACGVCIGGCW